MWKEEAHRCSAVTGPYWTGERGPNNSLLSPLTSPIPGFFKKAHKTWQLFSFCAYFFLFLKKKTISSDGLRRVSSSWF